MIDSDKFAYYDFGCSSGGFMAFLKKIIPTIAGVGIDLDEKKLEKLHKNGFIGNNIRIEDLPDVKHVNFVTMSHFLEHLGSLNDSRMALSKGIRIAKDFVFIRQPWFDSDGLLIPFGLKFYYSDWSGHKNKMTSLDFYLILKDVLNKKEIFGFKIYGRGLVSDGLSDLLIPLSAARNQGKYDPLIHGKKEFTEKFPFKIFREIVVVIQIGKDIELADCILDALGSYELIKEETISRYAE